MRSSVAILYLDKSLCRIFIRKSLVRVSSSLVEICDPNTVDPSLFCKIAIPGQIWLRIVRQQQKKNLNSVLV